MTHLDQCRLPVKRIENKSVTFSLGLQDCALVCNEVNKVYDRLSYLF